MYRVLKFGGSSVASATAMSRVLDIVHAERAKGKVILVSSAISGCTDTLLGFAAGQTDGGALEQRHLAIVRRLFTGAEREAVSQEIHALFRQMEAAPPEEKVTFGELLSTRILYHQLAFDGVRAIWLDSRRLVVRDDGQETYRRIREAVDTEADVFVAPGFICQDREGRVSTLGRGGSDFSAALYGAAVGADSLQIWTDVPGIMTANPKEVPAARTIPRLSYGAALDLAEHGAKVLYAPTVAPAMEAGLDIEIRNTFDPEGRRTVISSAADTTPWIGVTADGGILRIVGSPLSDVSAGEAQALSALREVGIAAMEIRPEGSDVIVVVRPGVRVLALQALHRAFFQTPRREDLILFIAGTGAVGKALLELVGRSGEAVAKTSGKRLRIEGLANSRYYGIDPGGHPIPSEEGDYVRAVIDAAPEGALFVDCTDSETLWTRYRELLEAGIGIISSNRRSFAIPYTDYAAIHTAARENGAVLRYETTVGAALPILGTMAGGAAGCDEIQSIEAVVSCTLNQILSSYSGEGASLSALVRRAQEEGLTEADPRMDLGGRDALRKLLILARVAGIPLEESDVTVEPAVPLCDGPLEQFYASLSAFEQEFAAKVREASGRGGRLRFVASVDKAPGTRLGYRASIRLQEVPLSHPAYFLEGTENAIIVQSTFHPYPLVIQGSGEGALQAAASILNDILR